MKTRDCGLVAEVSTRENPWGQKREGEEIEGEMEDTEIVTEQGILDGIESRKRHKGVYERVIHGATIRSYDRPCQKEAGQDSLPKSSNHLWNLLMRCTDDIW